MHASFIPLRHVVCKISSSENGEITFVESVVMFNLYFIFFPDDKHFKKFLEQTKTMTPEEKAAFLEKDTVCFCFCLY